MRKRFEETQRLRTYSGSGVECYVVQLTTFGCLEGDAPAKWVPVNQAYRTAEGTPVQLRADGAFVVISTGARLVRA